MESNTISEKTKEDYLEIENGNKININIVNNLLKIQVIFNSKEYLGLFSLNYLKKENKIFSYLTLIGIKDCINQRIIEKQFSIINDTNHLKLNLLFDNDNNIELIIPFNDKIKEVSLENFIRLETEIINLNNRINGIKNELKQELKKEILEELHEKEKNMNLNIKTNITKLIENKKPKILFYQKLEYISPVLVDQTSLTEVPYYTREFKTEDNYQIVQVNINIPYTSMDKEYSHGRILTYLDNEMINDSTIHNRFDWEIKPLTIMGYIQNLQKGNHKIKILACVDKGTLNIPHIWKTSIEYTIRPIISGSMTIIGF